MFPKPVNDQHTCIECKFTVSSGFLMYWEDGERQQICKACVAIKGFRKKGLMIFKLERVDDHLLKVIFTDKVGRPKAQGGLILKAIEQFLANKPDYATNWFDDRLVIQGDQLFIHATERWSPGPRVNHWHESVARLAIFVYGLESRTWFQE